MQRSHPRQPLFVAVFLVTLLSAGASAEPASPTPLQCTMASPGVTAAAPTETAFAPSPLEGCYVACYDEASSSSFGCPPGQYWAVLATGPINDCCVAAGGYCTTGAGCDVLTTGCTAFTHACDFCIRGSGPF